MHKHGSSTLVSRILDFFQLILPPFLSQVMPFDQQLGILILSDQHSSDSEELDY